MLLAQEITVVQQPDLWIYALSAVAIVVAGLAALATWRQGRAIRRIETREHEWEAEDRRRSYIVVQRMSAPSPEGRINTRFRLSNKGRVVARNVVFKFDDDSAPNIHLHVIFAEAGIDELHPGEHWDAYYSTSLATGLAAEMTVTWVDESGPQKTVRTINV